MKDQKTGIFLKGSNKRGILIFHGFTGAPDEMLYIGNILNKNGFTIYIPLLPGHGTKWRDLNRVKSQDIIKFIDHSYRFIHNICEDIYLIGFSLGGALALYTAENFSIKKIVLINPMVLQDFASFLGSTFSFIVPAFPARSDINDKSVSLKAHYSVYPLKGLKEYIKVSRSAALNIKRISSPVYIFRSTQDHLVSAKNTKFIFNNVSSLNKKIIPLKHSFHVAVMDFDKDFIAEKIVELFNDF